MTAGEEGQAWIVRLVMPAVTSEKAEAVPVDALVTADKSA